LLVASARVRFARAAFSIDDLFLCRFHQIEPQPDLPMLPQDELSQVLMPAASGAAAALPTQRFHVAIVATRWLQGYKPSVTDVVALQVVVSRSKRTVPYPILGENTLVLSETMVLTEDKGELTLMFRVGDTCAVWPLLIVCSCTHQVPEHHTPG
jgi:hypothetical protein